VAYPSQDRNEWWSLNQHALARDRPYIDCERIDRLQRVHAAAFARYSERVQPLPGAKSLLAYLRSADIPFAIATSGRMEMARSVLDELTVDLDIPVITRDQVRHGKPDPDLFLAAADRLGVSIEAATVVGDSVWDMLRTPCPRTGDWPLIWRLRSRGT
jgi:HAD superfamily hydrolase (TIGR01549 family)